MTRLTAITEAVYRSPAARFLVIGGASFVVDFSVLHALVWNGITVSLAAGAAWSTGFVFNYGLNRVWTFASDAALTRSLFRYSLLAAANLVITVVGLSAVSALGMQLGAAKVGFTVALGIMNFLLYRGWVFERRL